MAGDLLDDFDEGDAVEGPQTADGMPTVDAIIAKLARMPASLRARPLLVSFDHEIFIVFEVSNAGVLEAERHPF